MNERIERTLLQIARRYAPALLPANWHAPGDYARLTGRTLLDLDADLASANVFVFSGAAPSDQSHLASFLYKDWVDTWVDLYTRLAGTLFPTYAQVSALYADQNAPPIIFLVGAATPAIVAIHDRIAPFVVERCGVESSDAELRGLLDGVLDDLEAGDLPRDEFRRLRDECAVQVRELCSSPIRALDVLALPPAIQLPPAPPELPEMAVSPAPPPPPPLPEAPRPEFAAGDIPIFFDPRPSQGKRRPPVPNLPGE